MQGYYFAKPMPCQDFEEYLLAASMDKNDRYNDIDLSKWRPLNPFTQKALLLNDFVGGAAIVEFYNGTVELLRANDPVLYRSPADQRGELAGRKLLEIFDDKNQEVFLSMVKKAIVTGENLGGRYGNCFPSKSREPRIYP